MSNSLQERWPASMVEKDAAPVLETVPARGPVKRFLLRFIFAYLLLYAVPIVLNLTPFMDRVGKAYESLWSSFVPWIGKQLFQLDIVVQQTGSGDTAYDFMRILCSLVLAVVAGLAWMFLDRKRSNDARISEWLRVYVRFSLAAILIVYGASKVFSAQFGPPGLDRLLETFGEASPMGLLWTFMGSSRVYTLFAGLAELVGGILLISRRTTLLGALLSIGVLANVVLLNFCYDVPVKQFSAHLLAMAVLLTLPDLRRLANLFLFNRKVEPAEIRPLFRRAWLNRAALVLRTVFIAGFSIYWLYSSYKIDLQYGGLAGLARKTPFYGIWEVEEYAVNGQVRPPLITDTSRWRWLVFDEPGFLGIHSMRQERPRYYVLQLDSKQKRFVLTNRKDPKSRSVLSYQQPRPELLTVAGSIGGQKITARLHRIDESKLLLLSRGFHWISERPFNR
jgi:uncharacterized membrane protein YphA (DoxX/SURF4 family)